MRLATVLTVLKKELLDISRDRRAIFVMLVLPIVLYPLLIIGFTQASVVQMRTLESRVSPVWVRGLSTMPPAFRAKLEDGKKRKLSLSEEPEGKDEATALASGSVRAILVVPPSLSSEIANVTTTARVQVIYDGASDASEEARRQIQHALDEWKNDLVDERLGKRGLGREALEPVAAIAIDLAPKGAILGRMLAYILVMASLMGAFYPAIDLGAGEKERGTLETLLLAPARRSELALGKFAAVFLIALTNAVLNLASLGLTFSHFGSFVGGEVAEHLGNVTVSVHVVLAVLLVLVPVVALFSALALAISTQAKSYKEGMSYLQPLVIASVLLSMASALPGIELSTGLCLVPVAGTAVLVRELLGGTAHAAHAVIVVLAGVAYAALAIRWVARLYETEEVLVRPAAAKGLDLLVRAAPANPGEPLVPTMPQALAVSVSVLVLLWYFGSKLQQIEGHEIAGLVLSLVVLIALPPFLYAKKLQLDLRATFRIAPPSALALVAALLLGLSGQFLAQDLERLQEGFTGEPLAQERAYMERFFATLMESGFPLALLVIALAPGICEELMFRGFVLSGLRRDAGAGPAAVVSALLFAVSHMNPGKLGSVTALGIVLALLALRSGSIVPGMLCHATNNALALTLARFQGKLAESGFFRGDEMAPGVRFAAYAVFAAGLLLLFRVRPVERKAAA